MNPKPWRSGPRRLAFTAIQPRQRAAEVIATFVGVLEHFEPSPSPAADRPADRRAALSGARR